MAVVDQTPFFFHPIVETLTGQAPDNFVMPEDVAQDFQDAVTGAASSIDAISDAATEAIKVTPPVDAISGATAEATTVIPPPVPEATTVIPPPVQEATTVV